MILKLIRTTNRKTIRVESIVM